MIVLRNVTKAYGASRALGPLSLSIESEERIALVGPSGSGKSTLLRLILGLISPDEGTVTIGGVAMAPDSAENARLQIGYVIQDGGLFPHLTAEKNVDIVARQLGWPSAKIEARRRTLSRLVGLSPDLLLRYPVQLSGGERQRVGLMRALMLDPPVLLMDEPLGALDPVIRAKLQEDLLAIFTDLRKTVVLVTHDLSEAAFLAEEIAVLHDGRIAQKGPWRALVRHPKDPFVADFVRIQRPRWQDESDAS